MSYHLSTAQHNNMPSYNPFAISDSIVTYVRNIWPISRLSLNTTFKAEDSRLGYKTQ